MSGLIGLFIILIISIYLMASNQKQLKKHHEKNKKQGYRIAEAVNGAGQTMYFIEMYVNDEWDRWKTPYKTFGDAMAGVAMQRKHDLENTIVKITIETKIVSPYYSLRAGSLYFFSHHPFLNQIL